MFKTTNEKCNCDVTIKWRHKGVKTTSGLCLHLPNFYFQNKLCQNRPFPKRLEQKSIKEKAKKDMMLRPKTARKQAAEGPNCSRNAGKVNRRKGRTLATACGRETET